MPVTKVTTIAEFQNVYSMSPAQWLEQDTTAAALGQVDTPSLQFTRNLAHQVIAAAGGTAPSAATDSGASTGLGAMDENAAIDIEASLLNTDQPERG
jgi:hypothetical protein